MLKFCRAKNLVKQIIMHDIPTQQNAEKMLSESAVDFIWFIDENS